MKLCHHITQTLPNIMAYNSDDDFSYIGEVDANSNSEEDDSQDLGLKKNQNGKNVRGKDIAWRDVQVFGDEEMYKTSTIFEEIKSEFTEKRNNDWEYCHVYNYICKYSHRTGYLPCKRDIKVVFLSHCSEFMFLIIRNMGMN